MPRLRYGGHLLGKRDANGTVTHYQTTEPAVEPPAEPGTYEATYPATYGG